MRFISQIGILSTKISKWITSLVLAVPLIKRAYSKRTIASILLASKNSFVTPPDDTQFQGGCRKQLPKREYRGKRSPSDTGIIGPRRAFSRSFSSTCARQHTGKHTLRTRMGASKALEGFSLYNAWRRKSTRESPFLPDSNF